MPDTDAMATLIASAFSVAKDITVTGLLLWFVRMLLTGDVVRRAELDAANVRTETERTEKVYWREQFHAERQTARDAIKSLGDTVETAIRVRDDKGRR